MLSTPLKFKFSRSSSNQRILFAIAFAIVCFGFLFGTASSASAVACSGDTSWHGTNFSCDVNFADTGGSNLQSCAYQIKSNGVSTYPSNNTYQWQVVGCSGGNTAYTIPSTSLTVGANMTCRDQGGSMCALYLEAFDNSGLQYFSPAENFNIDYTPPVVSASTATNGTTTLSASDNTGGSGLAEARYSWGSSTMNSSCDGNGGGTPYVNGAYVTVPSTTSMLYLCARDGASNVGKWSGNIISADTIPPAISIFTVSPVVPSWVNSANPNVKVLWNVSDAGGSHLQRVDVYRAPYASTGCNDTDKSQCAWGTVGQPVFAPANSDGPWSSSLSDAPSDSIYWYGMHVLDNANNETKESQQGFTVQKVQVDKTAPSVGLISPTSVVVNTPVTLSSSVSDALSGIASCDLFVSGANQGQMTISTNGTASKSYTFASTQPYSVHASCLDNAQNQTAGSDVTVTVGNQADIIAPTISSFTANGKIYTDPVVATTTSTVTIAWTASDTGGSYLKSVDVYRASYATTGCSDTDKSQCAWSNVGTVSDPVSSDNGPWSSSSTNAPGTGTWWYGLHAVDNAGNCIKEDTSGTDKGHCGGVTFDTSDTRPNKGPIKVVITATAIPLPTVPGMYYWTDSANVSTTIPSTAKVSCVSTDFCMAVWHESGIAFASAIWNGESWSYSRVGGSQGIGAKIDVSCTSKTHCAGIASYYSNIAIFFNWNKNNNPAWDIRYLTTLASASGGVAIGCKDANFCIAMWTEGAAINQSPGIQLKYTIWNGSSFSSAQDVPSNQTAQEIDPTVSCSSGQNVCYGAWVGFPSTSVNNLDLADIYYGTYSSGWGAITRLTTDNEGDVDPDISCESTSKFCALVWNKSQTPTAIFYFVWSITNSISSSGPNSISSATSGRSNPQVSCFLSPFACIATWIESNKVFYSKISYTNSTWSWTTPQKVNANDTISENSATLACPNQAMCMEVMEKNNAVQWSRGAPCKLDITAVVPSVSATNLNAAVDIVRHGDNCTGYIQCEFQKPQPPGGSVSSASSCMTFTGNNQTIPISTPLNNNDGTWNISCNAYSSSGDVNTNTICSDRVFQSKVSSSITVDTTAPVLTQVTAVSSPTNDTTPDYTFSSTESGSITYGGDCSSNMASAVTGNNTVTFNTLAPGVHNNCTIKVTDGAGNQSNPLSVNAFTVDTTKPNIVAFTALPSSWVNSYTSNVRVYFGVSDNVGGSGLKEVQVWRIGPNGQNNPWASIATIPAANLSYNSTTNAYYGSYSDSATGFQTGETYGYGIHAIDNAGNLCNENDSPCGDTTLNQSPAKTPDQVVTRSVTVDKTPPTVTINKATLQPDPTNASPINFTAVFSESVSNFVASKVTLAGTAGATTAIVTGSGATYNVAVSGMTANGTVTAFIPANGVTDAAGNYNTASNSATVTYNTIPGQPGTPTTVSPTQNTKPTWTWTAPTTGNPASYTVQWQNAIPGSPTNYASVTANSFTHTTALADGTWYMKVQAIGPLNNPSPFSNNGQVVVDTTRPNIYVLSASPAWVNAFSQNVSIYFEVSDGAGSGLQKVEVWRQDNKITSPFTQTGWHTISTVLAKDLILNSNSTTTYHYTYPDSVGDLIDGQTYGYGIHAIDNAGNLCNENDSPCGDTTLNQSPAKTPDQVVTRSVTVDKTAPPRPTCVPAGGTFLNSVLVTCSDAESGVTIRYTEDATAPTTSSTQYTGAFNITNSETLTASAWDAAGNRSQTPDSAYGFTITHNTLPQTVSLQDDHATANYCSTTSSPISPPITVSWQYSDPDTGAYESAYQVQISTDNFSTIFLDTGKVSDPANTIHNGDRKSYAPPAGTFSYNTTYYWRVKVWDDQSASSSFANGTSFSTPPHYYPIPDFTWSPVSPSAQEQVQFTDQTNFSSSATNKSWSWDFGDGSSSKQQNPKNKYKQNGSYAVSLTSSDDAGSCKKLRTLNIGIPFPQWQEISPF